MKTTIDLPDSIMKRTKIVAAQRRTTIKNLVIEGLERVLEDDSTHTVPADALARLHAGYNLGGTPMSRDETHAR